MDILEAYDAEVIYDFDRLHENIPDEYWANCKAQGILFNFNADQVLSTIFLYLESLEGFTPIGVNQLEDIQVFHNIEAVKAHSSTLGLPFSEGAQRDGGSLAKSWARIDSSTIAIHYEFVGQSLARITLMAIAV